MAKRFILIILLCIAATPVVLAGKNIKFDDYFTGSTLRIDYQLCGNSKQQSIALDALSNTGEWAGRKHHLDSLPLFGNGQLVMKDVASGVTIYQTSFSTLFIEWLATDEATKTTRSFEHTVLVPMPKAPAEITVTIVNSSLHEAARITHAVDPADILIAKKDNSATLDFAYLHKSGKADRCIDVIILAEGYDATERDTFYADARVAMESLFAHEPFKSRKKRFNIIAAFTPSRQSGMSVPHLGIWKDTAFNSHFSTFYSDRYLTTSSIKKVHDAIAGLMYEHIIILANTDEYGGGGIYNSYTLTTAHHRDFRPVVVHEFGHSFGGLADEYDYGDAATYDLTVEPWEQNITTGVDFASKWQDMALKQKDDTMLYEGAAYNPTGMYRSSQDCRMRTNAAQAFCPVCQRALSRLIDFYTK